ncbi:phenylacetate--CoA ligase family protein [Skermania piniformis]|uniref:Phenylacetate--CoA ligase family protein n=1 Tax=Skermania pinensis TaxID=39122 RepID=A0ABX8SBT3_9ACTN|nr:phenylacetate--CoA ligase family protein [Skermania piniformis]QXQ15324.1 phenylacetate--CoA ligase family protein [Skermania piniformis]
MPTPPGVDLGLNVFRRAVGARAYSDFLADHGVAPATIRTEADYSRIPVMTKDNYLRRYPLDELIPGGDLTDLGTWWTSSGSTGRSTYWGGAGTSTAESVDLYDRIFRRSFAVPGRSVLVVNGFAMGNWIGGIYTYLAALGLRSRKHRLSVITPGMDIERILDNIATLGPHYDQVILTGYPPFVKDVLDQAPDPVLHRDLRLLLAGENVTEEWRDQILGRIGRADSAEHTTLIYGTADAGVMGNETPTTIAVRRLARADPALYRALYGAAPTQPTFVEYEPAYRCTEAGTDGSLLFTADTPIPLVRYRINDLGRVISAAELDAVLRAHGHDLPIATSSRTAGFIALHGRTDVAATFYAVKLYHESVRPAIEDRAAAGRLSGKFVLSGAVDADFEQHLVLDVELCVGGSGGDALATFVQRSVVDSLRRTSTEYRKLHDTLGERAEPRVELHPYGSDRFLHGPKHRWTAAS